jgi:hypothetical protein
VEGTEVSLLTDSEPGKLVDRDDVMRRVEGTLRSLSTAVIAVQFREDPPRIDATTAREAVKAAERMLGKSITLSSDGERFTIAPERIGSWIVSNRRRPAQSRR